MDTTTKKHIQYQECEIKESKKTLYPYIALDTDLKITYANSAFNTLFCTDTQKAIGQSIFDYLGKESFFNSPIPLQMALNNILNRHTELFSETIYSNHKTHNQLYTLNATPLVKEQDITGIEITLVPINIKKKFRKHF